MKNKLQARVLDAMQIILIFDLMYYNSPWWEWLIVIIVFFYLPIDEMARDINKIKK